MSNLLTALRHISFHSLFSAYFDATERRLVARSIVIGALVWMVVILLKLSVKWTFAAVILWVEGGPSPWLMLIPLSIGALIMTFFSGFRTSTIYYRDSSGHVNTLRDVEGDGMERAIALYYASEPALEQTLLGHEGIDSRWELPTFSLAIRKFLATLATLGSGASGGLTSSVSLIGESIAAGLFKPRPQVTMGQRAPWLLRFWHWWRSTSPDDLQTAQLCGIAAAAATILGAPFAAAFFAVEVMYRRRPVIEKLLYALLSALVAFLLSSLFLGHTTLFELPRSVRPPMTVGYFLALGLMALLVAQIGVYFIWLRGRVSRFFRSGRFNDVQRNLTGFLAAGVIGVAAAQLSGQGLDFVLGTGTATINHGLMGTLTVQVALIAFVGKLLATLSTVGSGGSAGLLVPSIFLGSMIAVALAPFFDLQPAHLMIPAVTASLVSIVNVPIAATLLVVEIFGSTYLVPALVVLVLTLIFTHNTSIYRTQREYNEKREILPGYSVRRVAVPPAWTGKTVADLQIRARYGLNVIGLVEEHTFDDHVHHHLALNPALNRPLRQGDMLLLLGADAQLDQFQLTVLSNPSAESSGNSALAQRKG